MKCCVSTDVGTWTNGLTFEPDPDHSPDARTGLLSPISYRLPNFAALPRLPASCTATWNFTLGKSHVILKWFYSLSRWKTFVGGKCAVPSALLVLSVFGWQWEATLHLCGTRRWERTLTDVTTPSGRAIDAATTTSCCATTEHAKTSTTGNTATWASCRPMPSSPQVCISMLSASYENSGDKNCARYVE